MVKRKSPKVTLLHAHGNAGPGGKRSYLKFGTFSTRKKALEESEQRNLDRHRIVASSKVKSSKLKGARGLYYIQ